MRLTISRSVLLFGIMTCLGMASIVAISSTALRNLEITGPLYRHIAAGKDLLGDILPPPEYVIEAYLDANLAAQNPADLPQYQASLKDLRAQYEDRRTYWQSADLAPDLRQELTVQSDTDVQQFWQQLNNAVIPAIASGNQAEISRVMQQLGVIYRAHRAIINDIVTKATQSDAQNEAQAGHQITIYTTLMYAGLSAVILLVASGLFLLTRKVVRPINGLSAYMALLAQGELKRPVPYLGRADEIGAMANSTSSFRTSLLDRQRVLDEQERERAAAEATRHAAASARDEALKQLDWVVTRMTQGLDKLTHGDLAYRITEAFPQTYQKLQTDFNQAMQTLAVTMRAVAENADAVGVGAGEITEASDDLARRTEQQAAALEQTAAALDQITVTVRKTATAAADAQAIVTRANHEAAETGIIVAQAVEAMKKIQTSSSEIETITSVIDEIAFQTNLLALNAGVEAARAGDAGRGFAVVATEVRALAQRSAEAAKEIKSLILASGTQVASGVRLVSDTGKALSQSAARVGQIDQLVADIAASANEQASALHGVNGAVNQMDKVTQQNAAMVEQATAACHSLSGQAEALSRLLAKFSIKAETRPATPEYARNIAARPPVPHVVPANVMPANATPAALAETA